MALSLIQPGSGGALCVYAAPLPDVSAGAADTTTPPGIPAAMLAALGPVPCVVGVNARGTETAEEILSFARAGTGRDLWWGALIGASRGCSKVRDLWMDGARALALVLGDGMHGAKPPSQVQLGYAQSITALARTGALLVCMLHTYIDPGPTVTSTAAMARLATGWPLVAPPAGQTVRRVQEPVDGTSRDPAAWRGELVVYSRGSGPGDKAAHQDVLGRLLPAAVREHVRPLVEFAERPVVAASEWPSASPEPEAQEEASSPAKAPASVPFPGTVAPAGPVAGVRYLLIGDSLARGLGPPLAALALRAGVPFWGEGVNGATIRQWLGGSVLVDAIRAASDPTMALVCLGTNDMRLADPAAEGHRAGELIAALRRSGVAAVRWIAPPPMPFDAPDLRTTLASECSARDVRMFDSAALDPPLDRASDGVHLTPAGYKAWADAVARWVPFTDPGAPDPATPARMPAKPTKGAPQSPMPAPRPAPATRPPAAPLSGTTLPPPRPRARGEGRSLVDPRASLGERAAQFALEEQRDGVREDPPGSNRGPRIDAYRRGLGAPGDPWCGFGFCYSAYAVLQPGETLPHAYSGRVAEILRSGRFHRRGDNYQPHVGDGAVFTRGDQDPSKGGNGHIGRVLVVPDAAGRFETVEANSGDAWAQRVHHLDEPALLGWIAYPQPAGTPERQLGEAAGLPALFAVEGAGAIPLEEYVARVVTAELGSSRQLQALAALAMAARTYAVWMLRHEGLGTDTKPMPNSAKKQVVARAAAPLCIEAARATRGGIILHKHAPILASHNAGATWQPGALTGAGGRDETHTEKNITYNRGLKGRLVRPTPIASARLEGNRGCFSQNGADELARQGHLWPDICRYFYGADVEFTIAEPGMRALPKARPETSGGDLLPLIAAIGVGYRFLG